MPLRKTDAGWWWGSKGPFKNKAKALQVARAAYAHGYKKEADYFFEVEKAYMPSENQEQKSSGKFE